MRTYLAIRMLAEQHLNDRDELGEAARTIYREFLSITEYIGDPLEEETIKCVHGSAVPHLINGNKQCIPGLHALFKAQSHPPIQEPDLPKSPGPASET